MRLLIIILFSLSAAAQDTTKAKVVTFGDSNNNGYSTVLNTMLDTSKYYPVVMRGVAGQDFKNGYLQMDSLLEGVYNPAISRNILVIALGTNDIWGTVNPDTTKKYQILLFRKARDMGFLPIGTICASPRHQPDSDVNVHYFATWKPYEIHYRASWKSVFRLEEMIPLIEDPYIGMRLNSNLDYWSDFGVHYTTLGYTRIATVVKPYIDALYNRTGIVQISFK